ncbi:hypothetical protein [uncultured Parasutterella sp.]|uniref:hypothetical protein n=3 Tax=uncultured Parasutterella sp. TaxID=1263098 RepID=UPI00259635F9|nr:hypothetical protein [uncultured Parasutterella sp.]
MRQESKTEETFNAPKNDSYESFYSFCDVLINKAFEERKYFSIDLYSAQIANIKQLIYLCATAATAISAVIVCTPYWAGDSATLTSNNLCFILLIIGFTLCITGLFYGVYALRGEQGGILPLPLDSYLDAASEAYGTDSSFKTYEAKMKLLNSLDQCIDFFRDKTTIKAKKIRIINLVLMMGIGCAVAGTTALFSITLLENYYVKQRAIETSTEKSGDIQNAEKPNTSAP